MKRRDVMRGMGAADPAGHVPPRASGNNPWPCWPTAPRLKALRDAWFDAESPEAQQRLGREIQEAAMQDLPIMPIGSLAAITAPGRDLTGCVPGFAMFWNIRRA